MNQSTNQADTANNAVVTSYASSQNTASTQSATTTGQSGSDQGMKAVIGVFNSQSQAEKAINQLRQQGFGTEEINIVSKEQKGTSGKTYDDDITDGALTGGTLGGIGGLLVGAGATNNKWRKAIFWLLSRQVLLRYNKRRKFSGKTEPTMWKAI